MHCMMQTAHPPATIWFKVKCRIAMEKAVARYVKNVIRLEWSNTNTIAELLFKKMPYRCSSQTAYRLVHGRP